MNPWEKLITHYLSEIHKPEVKDLRLLFGIDNIEPFIDEPMNDRLYWVEARIGTSSAAKCAAWRNDPESQYPWTALIPVEGRHSCRDEAIRIIHEIIPEGMKYDTTNP